MHRKSLIAADLGCVSHSLGQQPGCALQNIYKRYLKLPSGAPLLRLTAVVRVTGSQHVKDLEAFRSAACRQVDFTSALLQGSKQEKEKQSVAFVHYTSI